MVPYRPREVAGLMRGCCERSRTLSRGFCPTVPASWRGYGQALVQQEGGPKEPVGQAAHVPWAPSW